MAFSSKQTLSDPVAKRYAVGESIPTEEGRLYAARNSSGDEFFVHRVGRTVEQMAQHAVAMGTASGKLITYREFAEAVLECGNVAALQAELSRVAPAPKRSRSKRSAPASTDAE